MQNSAGWCIYSIQFVQSGPVKFLINHIYLSSQIINRYSNWWVLGVFGDWHYVDRANVAFKSHLYGGVMLELFQEMYCISCTLSETPPALTPAFMIWCWRGNQQYTLIFKSLLWGSCCMLRLFFYPLEYKDIEFSAVHSILSSSM